MKPYKNSSGNSGVRSYETGKTCIRVKFTEGPVYTYSYKSAGRKHIEHMKLLAAKGKGLASYISQYVKDKFEHNFTRI